MPNSESVPIGDHDLDRALFDLLALTEKEPVSPQLRELVQRLEVALDEVR